MTLSTFLRATTGTAIAMVLTAGLTTGPTTSAQAEPVKYVLADDYQRGDGNWVDATHWQVMFSLWHGGFSRVRGRFREIDSAELVIDEENPENSSIKMVVEAASLDTNHPFRDNWARSAQSLDVWATDGGGYKHRWIVFESTKVEPTGDNTATITGNLTMRGVTKEITLDAVRNKAGKHFSGKTFINGFTATGTISREDFGMTAFTPWISDEMEFTVELEAVRPVED